jgi:hypothetical protein
MKDYDVDEVGRDSAPKKYCHQRCGGVDGAWFEADPVPAVEVSEVDFSLDGMTMTRSPFFFNPNRNRASRS